MFPTKGQKASTVVFVEKVFVHYGLPQHIRSYQGREFERKLIKRLLDLLCIHKSWTTPYHPHVDAQPEWFNATLLDMLATLSDKKKQHWNKHIAAVVHVYNSTENSAMGYSPCLLMFGREAWQPIDLSFGTSFALMWKTSYQRNREWKKLWAPPMPRSAEQNIEQNFELIVRIQDLQPGDRLLLRNLSREAQTSWPTGGINPL